MYVQWYYLGEGIFAVHKCKSYALINDNGKYITEFIYDKISTMRTPDSDEFSGIAYMIRDRYQYGGWAHRYIYDHYNLDRDGSGYQPRKYKGYIKWNDIIIILPLNVYCPVLKFWLNRDYE